MKHYTVPEVNWNPVATSNDISKELLSAFMKQNITDVRKTLHKMNLTKNEGDREFIKNEGILLFAKDIKPFFPDFYVDILVYPSNSSEDLSGFTDNKYIHATIPSAINEIMGYLETTIIQKTSGDNPAYNYPPTALRTALVHAFIHARYNEPIHIIVEPESISILGSHQKMNSLLKRYLAQAGLIYPDADCVATLKKQLVQNGSPEPEITIEPSLHALCIAIKLHPAFMNTNESVAIQKYVPFEGADIVEPKIPLYADVAPETIEPIASELKELDFQQELFYPTEPEPVFGQIPEPNVPFYDEHDLQAFEQYIAETELPVIEESPPEEESLDYPVLYDEELSSPETEDSPLPSAVTTDDATALEKPNSVETEEQPQAEEEPQTEEQPQAEEPEDAVSQTPALTEEESPAPEPPAEAKAPVEAIEQPESVEEISPEPEAPSQKPRQKAKKPKEKQTAEEKPVKRTVRKFTSKKSQMESLVGEKDREKVQPLIDYLQRHDSFSFAKAQELLNKSPATASRYIKILINAGILTKTGTQKDVVFEKVKN